MVFEIQICFADSGETVIFITDLLARGNNSFCELSKIMQQVAALSASKADTVQCPWDKLPLTSSSQHGLRTSGLQDNTPVTRKLAGLKTQSASSGPATSLAGGSVFCFGSSMTQAVQNGHMAHAQHCALHRVFSIHTSTPLADVFTKRLQLHPS